MVYGVQMGGLGEVVYCAVVQRHCNGVGNAGGGGGKRMIDKCTKASKEKNILYKPKCNML